jgi:hypothetical protein
MAILLLCFRLAAAAQEHAASHEQEMEHKEHPESKEAEAEPGCLSSSVKAITDRPTVSSGTETTQCGVWEVLSGPERFWTGHGVHQDDVVEETQFGLTPSLDLHYARSNFFSAGSHGGPFTGTGDSFVGARYRFSKESKFVPSFGAFYKMKIPTASPAAGMGTGRYDHSLSFIAGKDLPHAHVDFNVTPTFAGRPDGPGYDKNTELLLFGSVPVAHGLTLIAGGFGFTALNDTTPAYAMGTLGFAWQVVPRLILDVGWDEGLTTAAPRKRIGFGLTCAPGNIYALVRGSKTKVE